MEVSLEEMLSAREQRALRQQKMLEKYRKPLISFSMNIPGPIKDSPLIRRGFQEGLSLLKCHLPRGAVAERQEIRENTGCEALYSVSMDALELKKITTAIEDSHPLGRLFDMDVVDASGRKLDRRIVGGNSRNCIICGAPGRNCASRRTHSAEQLQQKVREILTGYFLLKDQERIAAWAVESLLDEVSTTPKPGLVDLVNNGSHRDMDVFTFAASASALGPYFMECVRIGENTRSLSPEETFRQMRAAGIRAEETMYEATQGVNTHKGAIFTMGLLCGSAGRLWNPAGSWETGRILREVMYMTQEAMTDELKSLTSNTAGAQIYRKYGISGIRGEAANGFPAVAGLSLPVYKSLRAQGLDKNRAGSITMLHLLSRVSDTNMIARGGAEGAAWGAHQAKMLICGDGLPSRQRIEALDRDFISRNLSPGGCADLLAATYFLEHFED